MLNDNEDENDKIEVASDNVHKTRRGKRCQAKDKDAYDAKKSSSRI